MIRSQSAAIGLRHLDHAQDAGGVDPELQGAGFGRGALGQREHRGALGHVETHGHEPGARLDRRDVGAIDPVAVREERLRKGPAQIAGRAR